MRIALVGAGFAGLAAAWHLMQQCRCEVTFFDQIGIGGGASGIATGLLHPYPGEQGRRSRFASEGIEATKELIAAAQKHSSHPIILHEGLIRFVQNEEQRQMFLSHSQKFGDVKAHGENSFWIESGMTIDCPRYLEGLWQALAAQGARLVVQEVKSLNDLQEFDCVVLAAGAGTTQFSETAHLNLSTLKGQVLKCRIPHHVQLPEASSICKGYLALTQDPGTCFLGSTYQRGDDTLTLQPELAREELFPKIARFYPDVHQLEVIDCRAAFRVTRSGHYLPIVQRVNDRVWTLTALGSRGLLYHAYFGKELALNIYMNSR
jgi:glycine/D-amino acid oxidase-like deaminating enzyme